MCGVFGSYQFDGKRPLDATLASMAEAIAHRGPDSMGYEIDNFAALGNTRLSILDLSRASDQPFLSEDGKTILVQNGEIYNYVELREQLKRHGSRFATSGDTEVLLRAFEYWGPSFVERLNGMFAIAIYDSAKRNLWLYRDRLGVKPLYISGGIEQGRVWFASEIKAILAAGVQAIPNYDALAQFMALNYIPAPATAFEGITHLPPGHLMQVSPDGVQVRRYWDLNDVVSEPDMSVSEAKSGILTLLDDATRIRMRSDAPFGAFLSGGLDSSSVVGFMSMHQTAPVKTFSIGFDNPHYDETKFAQMAARRFGTFHQSRTMTPDVAAMWPRFIWHVDQPHGDVSFMPTDTVSKLAVQDVKMVLTGDGGDELFAGYDKYLQLFVNGQDDNLPVGWEQAFVQQSGLLQGHEAQSLLAGELSAAFSASDPYSALRGKIEMAAHQDPINRVLVAETLTLLPGNNLVKPDRMAMANSLEVRSPFLDYRMAELAFRIPGRMKLAGGRTKAIYKDAVRDLLGDELTDRRKQMFTVPVGDWFRQALAGYCREILLDGRLASRGIVNAEVLTTMVESHISGLTNYTRQLRALISLEIWFRLFIDADQTWLNKAKNGDHANGYQAERI